jgi:TonB-dependent starch-binding outer membrane protein SusC
MGNPLSIKSTEVESIDVLKDADATAIYGSRGANGAVLLSTKIGKTGRTWLRVNLQCWKVQVAKTMYLLNTQQ